MEPTAIKFNQEELNQLKSQLQSPKQITLIGHVSPDGDSLGSTLALSLLLKKLGHTTSVVHPTDYPPSFGFLKGSDEVIVAKHQPEEAIKALQGAEIIFLMDFNEVKRVEQLENTLANANAFKVMIDHHLHPTSDVDLCFSYPVKPATCLLLYELIEALGYKEYIDQSIAECLYTGMATDTGGFSYNSQDPKLYTTISELLNCGLEKDKISSYINRSYTIDKIRLSAYLLDNNLTFYPQYHTAIITMSQQDKRKFDYQIGDTEGLVNEPLAAKEILFSIFLHEQAKYTKVSLRSKGSFPVNQFAKKFFNGGGHLNAAGAEVYTSLQETTKILLEAIKIMHPSHEDE
ncbi:DHH family phosphoesterase [uncultured Porphyromonas sp.]|uniref:DHH family phosphoesterase n=1 Tax=uncultured Porphyromonas sp. TaxID=159274 RepID=UPI00262C1937|nr:DHH family phosphoesterase [uncultured Porphyromonas sp.]